MTPITKEELLRLRDRLAEEWVEKAYPVYLPQIDDGFKTNSRIVAYKAGFDALLVPLLSCVEALDFYADKENWDTENMSPTVWDDGNIDLGRRAFKALTALAELVKEKK